MARDLDAEDNLVKFRDIDCTGSACGALIGAMSGLSAFPQDWVKVCIESNIEVYGFDIDPEAGSVAQELGVPQVLAMVHRQKGQAADRVLASPCELHGQPPPPESRPRDPINMFDMLGAAGESSKDRLERT